MKIETRGIVFILSLIVFSMNVSYLSNEGMYWGFSLDDIFWFTMNYTGELDDVDNREVYLQVHRLANIPSYESSIIDLGPTTADIRVHHSPSGTFVEMVSAPYRITLSYHRVYESGGIVWTGGLFTPLAFPLGNLSYITDLVSEHYGQKHVTILESEDYWGFEFTYNRFRNDSSIYLNWNVTMQAHFDYSKDDGFLAHYHGQTTYVDSGAIFQEVSLERDGLEWQTMTPYDNTIPADNTTPAWLYYEQLVLGTYVTAGFAWIIAIIFMTIDYRKRVRDT